MDGDGGGRTIRGVDWNFLGRGRGRGRRRGRTVISKGVGECCGSRRASASGFHAHRPRESGSEKERGSDDSENEDNRREGGGSQGKVRKIIDNHIDKAAASSVGSTSLSLTHSSRCEVIILQMNRVQEITVRRDFFFIYYCSLVGVSATVKHLICKTTYSQTALS